MIAAIIGGLLYIGGALAYWNKLKYHEAFLTAARQKQENDSNLYVEMLPWQKTLMCALWPVVIVIEELGYLSTTIED